jgi:hypothetical protein
MGVTAGIFLASILLKEMRYLVYIRYLWWTQTNYATSGNIFSIKTEMAAKFHMTSRQ